MIPYITTPAGDFSTFVVMAAIGILLFLAVTYKQLKNSLDIKQEIFFIFPKIAYSFLAACVFSGLLDSLSKFEANRGFIFQGSSFYGGLFGGITAIYLMLYFSHEQTEYTIANWFNFLTPSLIIFHICGRIGCFLAGCCYGKTTTSNLGIPFPDNPLANIYHYGEKCYPTQLFEVLALTIIFILINATKEKFSLYIVLYGISRFVIEFFRGDYRGVFLGFLSPAQSISLILIVSVIIKNYFSSKKLKS